MSISSQQAHHRESQPQTMMICLRMLLIGLAPLAGCRKRFIVSPDTTSSGGSWTPVVMPCRIRRHSTTGKVGGEISTRTGTANQIDENDLPVSTVLLKRTKQSKAFRNGNQLVFDRAIKTILLSQSSPPGVAELVRVAVEADHKPVVLGWGVYNPHSLYRVRFLCHRYLQPQLHHTVHSILTTTESNTNEPTKRAIQAMVQHHAHVALETRRAALNLPTTFPNESVGVYETNTYRLVNGEGDNLSGLAIDVIDNVAVIMSSALWCEANRDIITEVIENTLPDHEIVWKTTPSRLQQDGADQLSIHETEQWLELQPSHGTEDKQVLSKENGVIFATFPFTNGQKTGVYCDQRENRYHVATLARNKRVLDLCCYHGGFSLTAIVQGGASSAVGVDSSPDAIETCRLNAELNQCTDKVDFVRADITAFLQDQYIQNERYDIVVLDPPKLAPSTKALEKARRKYHGLNRDAIKIVSDHGGLLMTCTCSAAMTHMDGGQYFLNMVQGAALAAGRQVTLLRVSGAASCHTQSPIAWPASAYLTAALFYVHPLED